MLWHWVCRFLIFTLFECLFLCLYFQEILIQSTLNTSAIALLTQYKTMSSSYSSRVQPTNVTPRCCGGTRSVWDSLTKKYTSRIQSQPLLRADLGLLRGSSSCNSQMAIGWNSGLPVPIVSYCLPLLVFGNILFGGLSYYDPCPQYHWLPQVHFTDSCRRFANGSEAPSHPATWK